MAHLRALHSEMVVILDGADIPLATSAGRKRDARLIEILRSIAELVRPGFGVDHTGRRQSLLDLSQVPE